MNGVTLVPTARPLDDLRMTCHRLVVRLLLSSAALVHSLSSATAADAPHVQTAPIALNFEAARQQIPEEFSGFSFEMQRVLPASDGTYFFRPDNQPLLTLFRTLGIRSLRIGGNTADRPSVPLPATADIDSLFAFARAAKVSVIFTLRLRDGDPQKAAETAKYISDKYSDLLTCVALGNEPSVFAKDYPSFRETWLRFADLINSPDYAPRAKFGGPAATAGTSSWTRHFAREFGPTGRLLLATQHIYPGGNSDLVKDPAVGRDLVLSREWVAGYQRFHDGFVPDVLAQRIAYRLEETNSFWNGGREDVSDTFAAALWALDYQHWWASHGAAGLNFHTGDYVAKSEVNTRCMYAAFWTVPTGLQAKPLAYALKAFDLARNGRIVPVTLAEPAASDVNVTPPTPSMPRTPGMSPSSTRSTAPTPGPRTSRSRRRLAPLFSRFPSERLMAMSRAKPASPSATACSPTTAFGRAGGKTPNRFLPAANSTSTCPQRVPWS